MQPKLLVAVVLLMSACGALGFDVSQPIPQQTIQGSALGALLPSFLPSPFAITINVKQEEQQHNTGPATAANLKSLSFQALPHGMPNGNFDFVDEIHIFVAASNLPMLEIATLRPVPKGLTTLDLTVVPGVNLLPYINAGATISAQASGHQPAQDFSYDGTVVITIRI
jgi:hypothetical protein